MRAGVIGVGKLGSIHLRIYGQTPGIRQIYIADSNPLVLTQHPDLESFSDWRQLLGKVDLVSIATPTVDHCRVASFFLKNKIPVLVEKPITSTLREADKLLKLAAENKTLLFVGHVERYNSAYLAAKKIIKNPLFIECHRLSPYPYRSIDISVVLDLMIHDLDIILDLVKDDIKRLDAQGVKVLSPSADIANVRLAFKHGCVANITSSRISDKKERKIRVFTPDSYISLDYANQSAEIYRKENNGIVKDLLPITKEEPLKKEIQEFVSLVREKSHNPEFAEKARDALALALRIQKKI